MITTKITGLDALIREYDRKLDGVENALSNGTQEAGEHLIECIEEKFGTYQSGWAQLKAETIAREKRMGAGSNASKPLVMFGDMMFSFYQKNSVRTRKHVVHILSDDPKIMHHMYGAPQAGVPKRDPVRPTTKEESDTCKNIIRDAVIRELK